MRVLVTGAAGFVGSVVARRLLERGDDVHLLVRAESDRWRLAGITRDARLHRGDLADATAVHRAVRAVKPDAVLHLAVHGAYSWQRDVQRMLDVNVRGFMHLLDAASAEGVACVVNTGSSSEYGFADHAPTEDELPHPNSGYAVTKAMATLLCGEAWHRTGMRIVTLRLYSVFGPYEEPRRLMPKIVTHALRGTLPPLADPRTARDFVYVDDVADAYCRAITHGPGKGSVYNIGSGRQATLAEVAEVTRRRLKVREAPKWGDYPDRSWDTSTWISNPTLARREIGWQAATTLSAGIAKFAAWFDANPAMLRRYRATDS